MKKTRSLKKEILQILILFSVFIAISIGLISMFNFYFSKLSIVEYNQRQILHQVESEVNKSLSQIYKLATYLKNNYKDNNLLKNIVDTNSNISSILILDKNGVIEDFYAPVNFNIFKGFDYSKKDYFKNLDKNREDYWSNVFLSSLDETSSISYSFKMNDKVAVLMVKLKELSEFIERFKNQDGTHMIRIIDSTGVVILNHDVPNLVLQRISIKNADVYKNLILKVQAYEFSKFEGLGKNETQYGTYTNIDKTSWKIVSRESYDLILKSLNNIIYGALLSIIGFILVSILISLKISKRIFKSFDDLQQTTTNIANGNYDVEIKKSYYEEFNKLLTSFNKMRIEIDKREDALEASVDSFKSLVNLTMEAIIIHKNSICVDVNDVAVKLFAYDSKEEMIGKNFISFVGDNSKKLVESKLDIESEPYEIEFLKKDGTVFISLGQGKFIELFGDKLKVSTIIDITDIKQKDKLLFQQSKMASMGEMIGNIAHQWRQPLSAISSAASGMKLQKEYGLLKEEDFFQNIDAIVNSTQYLSKTIDDFRNFFKSDKVEKKFDISNTFENILSLVGGTLKSHGIIIQKDYESNYFVTGYENELIQALINILNNAKDALILNDIKTKVILISIKKVEDNIIRVSIKDSGGGIKKEIISSIFEPYFTTKYNQQGTGIGLYMSHQIIVIHMKGKITVQNNVFSYNEETLYGAEFIIDLLESKKDT